VEWVELEALEAWEDSAEWEDSEIPDLWYSKQKWNTLSTSSEIELRSPNRLIHNQNMATCLEALEWVASADSASEY
jgi:hypothetical protein